MEDSYKINFWLISLLKIIKINQIKTKIKIEINLIAIYKNNNPFQLKNLYIRT